MYEEVISNRTTATDNENCLRIHVHVYNCTSAHGLAKRTPLFGITLISSLSIVYYLSMTLYTYLIETVLKLSRLSEDAIKYFLVTLQQLKLHKIVYRANRPLTCNEILRARN